jgi:hypothetical protein
MMSLKIDIVLTIHLVFSGTELPYLCLERQMAVSMAVSGSQMHVVEGDAEEYPKKTCMACATRRGSDGEQ